jgi:hypothetical protein
MIKAGLEVVSIFGVHDGSCAGAFKAIGFKPPILQGAASPAYPPVAKAAHPHQVAAAFTWRITSGETILGIVLIVEIIDSS